MKKFIDIVEEIKNIVSTDFPNKRVYDKDIASILNISQMNFATMKKRNKIPYKELLDFCVLRSIAINWLLYGQSPESLIDNTNKFYMVRYFSEVQASAGGGGIGESEIYESMIVGENLLKTLGGIDELKYIEAINVTGDSMEPTFNYGDIVFINRDKCDVGRGGIFTIYTDAGLFIKRLHKQLDGTIDIISDNKDYPIQTATLDNIKIIGRVVGRFGNVE